MYETLRVERTRPGIATLTLSRPDRLNALSWEMVSELDAALPDGIRDARQGHKSFFWSALWDPQAPTGRLREGLTSTARVVLLGISMDVIYQFKALDRFYPVEALMMAILLAVIPYFVFRWIVERAARWWLARKGAGTLV